MRLLTPLPGMGLAALAGLAAVGAQVAESPTLQSILYTVALALPVVVLGWFARDHLALRRDREKDRKELEAWIEARHKENQRVAADYAAAVNRKMEQIDDKLDPVLFMVMGVQGREGYLDERERNRERRHRLANEIQAIRLELSMLGKMVERIGHKVGIPYDAPQAPSERRRNTDPDGHERE